MKNGLDKDPENVEMRQLVEAIKLEIEQDNKIPPDHPERKRF